jgi:hypothetical protein
MGKGSGNCDRPGATLEASDSTKTELNVSENVTSISDIDTALELHRLRPGWWTKDERVLFRKRKDGWVISSFSNPICKDFEEYGLISTIEGECTCFPSLKAAQQAVKDVSLEAGLNIDSRLTRQHFISYKIGDLPLNIRRVQGHWWVHMVSSVLSARLQTHFNSTQEFLDSWKSTGIAFAPHPTRKAAHQAVTNWLSQTITKGK